MGTEKMIEALKPLADAVFNDNGDITVQIPTITSEDCIKAYFAVRRAEPALSTDAEPVKITPSIAVNALEFETDKTIRHANKDGVTTFSAKTPFGAYLIRQYPDGMFTLAFWFSGELWEHHSTFEAAKAAAQADYEARILSALSAQVQDVP